MDQSQSNSELETIYETLNTAGWDLMVESFEEQHASCNQVSGCSTLEDLHYRRGMMAVFQQLFTLKDDIQEQMNADLQV